MLRNLVALGVLSFVLALPSESPAGLVNFDDGVSGNAIGNTYLLSDGVSFTNGTFGDNLGLAGTSGSLGLISTSLGYAASQFSPIVATFSAPQTSVSITAFDVGQAGVHINAYDAAVGGTLIGSDEYIGTFVGAGESYTLAVNAPSIQRIELFQPGSTSIVDGGVTYFDGIVFDNLSFSANAVAAVPEPASWATLLLAAIPLTRGFRQRRGSRIKS